MTSGRPRRQDTTKGPPLRILSLDGGGVRGYSMLILLQELMHRTFVEINGRAPKRHEIPKPSDHFDLIAGTGTGGLIAIMLGRLRLDLETCKDVYVRMTRRVFETDKTFAGIPFRSTLFKASKLEDAIRDCVREHTVFEDEGNDSLATAQDLTSPQTSAPMTPGSAFSPTSLQDGPARSFSTVSRNSLASSNAPRAMMKNGRWGNPDTLLYDVRENRTKTAVTAVYRGAPKNAPAALLRSYDSRKEPAPEFECAIWQAGRATSATALAFKPIQIGQSIFIDEGEGRFNPSPQILDEALLNEWPGRDVGVFVSVGTGKRPRGTDAQSSRWYESFIGGSMGEFAEAKRKLLSKIEGCERTHQYMMKEHLAARQVNISNYYRLNVECGVGEFGMNEWARLTDISTNTRMYLSRDEVQSLNQDAATKLGKIHWAKMRMARSSNGGPDGDRFSWQGSFDESVQPPDAIPPSNPMAVELPADEGYSGSRPASQYSQKYPGAQNNYIAPEDKLTVHSPEPRASEPRVSSDEYPQPVETSPPPRPVQYSNSRPQSQQQSHYAHSQPHQTYHPPPSSYHPESFSNNGPGKASPPPLPPKTPVNAVHEQHQHQRQQSKPNLPPRLPYPDMDGPPPPVNYNTKPFS